MAHGSIQQSELDERRAWFRKALGIGTIAWPAFFLLDAWVALVVSPGLDLRRFALLQIGRAHV